MFMGISSHFGCWKSGAVIRCKWSIFFFPRTLWFDLILQLWHYFLIKKQNICTHITHVLIRASNPIFYNFFHSFRCCFDFKLKLCHKKYNKIDLLHLIVAPQLSSGRWHNHSTKTRQVGHVNEHSIYSLMAIVWRVMGWLLTIFVQRNSTH
jgi:hypothetical protein